MKKVLYKYRDYSARSLEIIANRQVHFATSEQLNDPFDCRLDIVGSLEAARTKAEKRGSPAMRLALGRLGKLGDFYSKAEADTGKVGVFSLAQSPASAPMWAHYASNHKGFCLGFHLSEKFTKHDKDEGTIGMVPVIYCNDNPVKELFLEFAARDSRDTGDEDTLNATWGDFWQSIYSAGLTSKSKHWKYEREIRVLRKGGGLVSFDPSELVEVVFGLAMLPPTRKTVLTLLAAGEWKHVKVKEILRGPGFTLHVVDI